MITPVKLICSNFGSALVRATNRMTAKSQYGAKVIRQMR